MCLSSKEENEFCISVSVRLRHFFTKRGEAIKLKLIPNIAQSENFQLNKKLPTLSRFQKQGKTLSCFQKLKTFGLSTSFSNSALKEVVLLRRLFS